MRFNKTLTIVLVGMVASAQTALGQTPEKCGTVAYEKILQQQNPKRRSINDFENWMKTKLGKTSQKNNRTQSAHYVIPVVVHIIHNGTSDVTNISDAQVQSQIDVLNQDYPRLNADTVNTPTEFKSVAGTIDMEFVLAKQDPEGLPTTGIVRVKGTKTSWMMSDNNSFKALSYWPAENYLNIWVLKLQDPSGLIGYAQLPVSDLPGLEGSSNDRLTDGVAIDYRAFGVGFSTLYPQFDKGRTATHEIGHIFGLRHIWGDVQSCSGTDYCNDTPTQNGSTSGCPSQPALSCSHDKMFQNYMDYTDDPCMNVFSQDQIARMVVVLANSPRRASLLTSPGATAPVTLPYDLGIKSIISPVAASCPSITPSIVVRNYGANNLSGAQIQLLVNGAVAETVNPTFNLAHLDSAVVQFSALPDFTYGSHDLFHFTIESITSGTDGKPSNDTASVTAIIPQEVNPPILEPFNAAPTDWSIVNPDGQTTWTNAVAPNGTTTNHAMMMNFYSYESVGETDQLVTPLFDLLTDTAALLKFDRSYAQLDAYNDQLRVIVYMDCDVANGKEIFNKSGSELATAPSTNSNYIPTGASDWKTETISLKQFLGHSNISIAFVATNDYGNNLYLDNVRIITGDYTDLTLLGVKSPSTVTCVNNPTPIITIRNNGSNVITDFSVTTTINNVSSSNSFTGLHLDTSEEIDVKLSPWALINGTNAVVVTVNNDNEVNPADNVVDLNQVVSHAKDIVPIREDFDSDYPEWTVVSESEDSTWSSQKTNKSTSLVYRAFDNSSIGNKSWLVSPTLDFSKTAEGGLFFDLSYAKSNTGNERFQVLLSSDCGQTFPITVFDKTGDQFADTVSGAYWAPKTNGDWQRQFVNIDTLAGNPQGRIAFVVTNGHGNNLYIDNIEIFNSNNPTPVEISTWYSVYNNYLPTFKITFHLDQRQMVHLQVLNMLGQVVVDNMLPDTLNQTYDVDLSGQQSGIYLIRMQSGSQLGTAKVYVPQ